MDLQPPDAVGRIARTLEEAGFETWAVGGAVRDRVAGAAAGDWDLATRATPPEIMDLFRRTAPIGVDHGTVGVMDGGRMYEVTTFRRDVETDGRHAVVEYADDIREDLARRDFTINALAWHPVRGELLDPFHGAEDLRNRCLRTVGDADERFAEDYLRILRGLRFAGQFGLDVEADTWESLTRAVSHLDGLSVERVREELAKIMVKVRRPSRSLELYRTSGALEVLYPELAPLAQEPPDDPGALWRTTLAAVDTVPATRSTLRVATLLHAAGMPGARTRDLRSGWRYAGHEILGAGKAQEVMERLKASNAETEWVTRLVRHQEDLFPPDAPDSGVRRWLRDVGPELVNDLFRLRFALWRARDGHGTPQDLLDRWRTVRRVLARNPPLEVGDLAIGGDDLKSLGLDPGPRFREILEALLEEVLEDPDMNTAEALNARVEEAWLDE